MADPQTPNIGLSVPLRGSDVGTWDVPVNSDFTAIDGLFGGVLTLTLAAANIALSAPPSFSVAPVAGPVQSQNAVIRLTGAQSGNVQITLPAAGFYIVDNRVSTSGFVTTFKAASAGEIIGVPQGMMTHIFCDGTNVRFVDLGMPGKLEFLGGESALPAWISACTVKPYLLANGQINNIADFPALGAKFGSKFGGNGSTTFGVMDLQGRVPLAYDGTGSRVTTAVSGIDGQTIGSAGGDQNAQQHLHVVALTTSDMNNNRTHTHGPNPNYPNSISNAGAGSSIANGSGIWLVGPTQLTSADLSHGHNVNGNTIGSLSGNSQNMIPAQVAGIWLVKT